MYEHGGPEVLRLETVADPGPAEGEVLVRLEAIGVNFIDIYNRTGLYKPALPFTPGSEGAGSVVAIGSGVTDVRVGDRVASEGLRAAYAELALAPVAKVIKLPNEVDPSDAAAVMLQGMTAHYLATSTFPLGPGDWCLIHAAAGGTGLLLTQIARRRGARIIATVGSEAKAALAREAGAEQIILYATQDVVTEVKRITGGAGVRVAYDSVGRSTWEGSLDSLARRGMLVLFGQSSGPVPPIDPLLLMRKGSLYLTRPTLHNYVHTREELEARAADLFHWMADGLLQVRIDRRFPLALAADAQAALESRGTSGKVLLIP
jgi:NADPH2:quinone reductase